MQYSTSSKPSKTGELEIAKDRLIQCKEVLYPRGFDVFDNNKEDLDLILMKVHVPDSMNTENFRYINLNNNRDDTSDNIHALGYPAGTPLTKSVDGSILLNSQDSNFLLTDLDVFVGSSGSPVFDTKSDKLIGMVISGATDFIYNKQKKCREIKKCSFLDKNKCTGEKILKQSLIRNELEIYLEN